MTSSSSGVEVHCHRRIPCSVDDPSATKAADAHQSTGSVVGRRQRKSDNPRGTEWRCYCRHGRQSVPSVGEGEESETSEGDENGKYADMYLAMLR